MPFTTPTVHPPLYVFLSAKKHSLLHTKAFSGWFSVVLVWRLCFSSIHSTAERSYRLPPDCEAVFRCEGLLFQPFTSVHSPCECFGSQCECFGNRVNTLKAQPFTLETDGNQMKTHVVWRSECFFREIKCVYTRAQKAYFQNKLRLFKRDHPAS